MGLIEKKNVQFIASLFRDPRFFYKIEHPLEVFADEYFKPDNHMISFIVYGQCIVDFTHDDSEWFVFLTKGNTKKGVPLSDRLWGRLGIKLISPPGDVGEKFWAFFLFVKEFGIDEGMIAFEAVRKNEES